MRYDLSIETNNTRLYKHFAEMRNEVLKHKWIESEKANRDVGFEYALVDWVIKYKANWDIEQKNNN